MNRESGIKIIESDITWDLVIIGGGATGLGIVLDAALRGYKTLLLEQSDFTKGTSSRSTKLVHGGVRYLAQGNVRLVLEALKERGLLLKNAPHVTKDLTFVIPTFSYWKTAFYTIGLKLYDLLAGKRSLGRSEWIGADKVVEMLPTVKRKGLKGGIVYHDGQFDDARLGICLARSATDQGAHVLNYMKVTGLGKDDKDRVDKVQVTDLETGRQYHLKTKAVINATGVFVDEVLKMDTPSAAPIVRPSQGTHIVLDKSFLPGGHALMIPETRDGRVLFAIPWLDKVVVGTTDVLVDQPDPEPRAKNEEIDFILSTFSQYIGKPISKKDIRSVFSGLRPLVRPPQDGQKTKEISRDHKLIVSDSKLITITGGKWTTYRKMAEDAVNMAVRECGLPARPCSSYEYKLHGYTDPAKDKEWLSGYGSDAEKILELAANDPELSEKLHHSYPFIKAEVIWAVREEMARTVEDVLARRLRILFLDAAAAINIAPTVAEIIGKELNKNQAWIESQVEFFKETAKKYSSFEGS